MVAIYKQPCQLIIQCVKDQRICRAKKDSHILINIIWYWKSQENYILYKIYRLPIPTYVAETCICTKKTSAGRDEVPIQYYQKKKSDQIHIMYKN